MGINASGSTAASQTVVFNRVPTVNDSKNFIIGCLWLKPSTLVVPSDNARMWMLTALIGNDATWTEIVASGANGIVTIDGDAGSISGATVSVTGLTTAGSTVSFVGDNATAMTLHVSDLAGNTFIGSGAGDVATTGLLNTGLGHSVLSSITTGVNNTCVGYQTGTAIDAGGSNTCIGTFAGSDLVGGDDNTLLGGAAGSNIISGNNNIAIGVDAALTYTGAESNNIVIGSQGVIADSAKIRIGTNGTQTTTHIVGIDGVDVGNVIDVLVMSAVGDQLGTAEITAGAGISVTPGANTITIAATGIGTINGDVSSVSGSPISLTGLTTAGATVSFEGNGAALMTLHTTDSDSNTFIGSNAGNISAGLFNTALGDSSLGDITIGESNTALGSHSGLSLTTGDDNTLIGAGAADLLLTGNNNIIIGKSAGASYTGAESNNILLENLGTLGDSAKIRIGTQGTQTACHIVGIDGVNVGSVAEVVTMSAAGNQLGSAVITAGSGISVTPGANTITIAATGSVATGSVIGFSRSGTLLDTGSIRWASPFAVNISSTQAHAEYVMPLNGTVKNLYVNVDTNANTDPGTVTVNKNGVNTTLVATITATTTGVFSDTNGAHEVTYAAGDTIQFELSQAATGNTSGSVSVQFTPT